MRTSENIAVQIDILNKQLLLQPEKIDGKWNHKHFSLKGKLKKLEKEKIEAKKYEFLAR